MGEYQGLTTEETKELKKRSGSLVDRIGRIDGHDKKLIKKIFAELPFNMINSESKLEIIQEEKRDFLVYPIRGKISEVNFKGVDVRYIFGYHYISFTDHYKNNYTIYFLPRDN